MKRIVLGMVLTLFSVGLVGCSSSTESTSEESSSSYDLDTEFEKAKQSVADEDEDLVADPDIEYVGDEIEESTDFVETPKETSSSSSEAQNDSVTREQKNALGAAEDYLDFSSFSKQGLYDQLIFEEYPADAAQYAIDNISTDWNENALQTAQDYLDFSSFSDQGLYDQLIYDKYTAEEAQYAIDNLPD